MATTSSAANPHRASHRPTHRVNLGRHAAQCRICNHPSRAAIEFDFLNWRNPFDLVQGYGLRSLSTIYRHAHATGLFGRRRLNLRFALERMVERVNEAPVTASGIIRCVRAITRMNDAGEWIDPPSRVIISREDSVEPQRSPRGKSSRHNSSRANRKPNPPAATIFEPALLEEISPEELEHPEEHYLVAKRAAEKLSKAAKAPAPPKDVTILLSPEFAAASARHYGVDPADPRILTDPDILPAGIRESLIANRTHSPAEPNG